jgi:hypothetical protein
MQCDNVLPCPSKENIIGTEEISQEFNNLYHKKFIILSVIDNNIDAFHINIDKINCPFSRPRLMIPGQEDRYKIIYTPSPNLTKLLSIPIQNFINFYQEYSDYRMYICLINDVEDVMRNKINEVILAKNTTLVNISLNDINKYSNLALDFSGRFTGLCESKLIINGKDNETIIGIKNKNDWDIFIIKIGSLKIKTLFEREYDEFGHRLSLSDKINSLDRILLDEIKNLNHIIDFDYLNSLPFISILGYNSLHNTVNNKSMKNINNIYKLLGKMIKRINELYDILGNCRLRNVRNYYSELGHLILFSEILTYFYGNIRTDILFYSKKQFYNNHITLDDNWILGKILEDNNILK